MGDYISREAAEKILYDGCHTTDGEETLDDVVEMWHMVQAIPAADVVEIVQCKDCKFFYDGPDQKCCINHKGVVVTDENGFCHHAEKEEEWKESF